MTLETLAANTREARRVMERRKAEMAAGAVTYDDLATAARAFCDAWYAYQAEKVGKAKARRLDYRAVIR